MQVKKLGLSASKGSILYLEKIKNDFFFVRKFTLIFVTRDIIVIFLLKRVLEFLALLLGEKVPKLQTHEDVSKVFFTLSFSSLLKG